MPRDEHMVRHRQPPWAPPVFLRSDSKPQLTVKASATFRRHVARDVQESRTAKHTVA
eukprot:SAG31_NODE_23618_length_500_cov_1.144638_1_plen_56_part_10